MRYCSREEADKEIKAYIEELRKNAGIIPAIKKTVQEFDGKVLNCRLEKALEAATGQYIHVEKRYNTLAIYGYYKSHYMTFASVSLDTLTDGKRINAAAMIESLNDCRTKMLQEANEMEQQMQNVDIIRQQLESIKKLYEAVVSPVNSMIADYYRIEKYARF